jgi:hypothetical protein
MERANEHRSDFQEVVSQLYRFRDEGKMDSIELYARKIIKFRDSNWTFSENAEAMNLNIKDMRSREGLQYVYEIKEEISDDLNRKIRIIRRLFFGLLIAFMVILYIVEDHVLTREK